MGKIHPLFTGLRKIVCNIALSGLHFPLLMGSGNFFSTFEVEYLSLNFTPHLAMCTREVVYSIWSRALEFELVRPRLKIRALEFVWARFPPRYWA